MGAKRKGKDRRKERVFIPYEKEKKEPSWIAIGILLVIQMYPLAFLLLWLKMRARRINKRRLDYRNYATVIGDRCEVELHELSAKLGKTPPTVIAQLQSMIDKGYLGSNAYIDRSRGVLVLDALQTSFVDQVEEAFDPEEIRQNLRKAAEIVKNEVSASGVSESIKAEFRRAFDTDAARVAEEPPKPPEEERRSECETDADEFEAKLQEIRTLNDEIEDREVSDRIDRIGQLTASIFAVVREKPERANEVRKFMNYYLPTTFKLLKSYSLMEKQSYQGENITASRKKIEEILDSLITAFEHQQDRLFRAEALDVEADIQVLETMLLKDGLVTPKGMDMRSAVERS